MLLFHARAVGKAAPPHAANRAPRACQLLVAVIHGMIGAVRELLEHYLGDANMAHDVFLRELLAANGGVAPIVTLLTFPRLAAMLAEHGGPESARAAVVAVAVRDSALLLLSAAVDTNS